MDMKKEMEKGFLRDDFKVSGQNYEDFKAAVDFMEKHTQFVPFHNDEIYVLSKTKDMGSKTEGTFAIFNKEACEKFVNDSVMRRTNIAYDSMDVSLIEEMENTTEMLMSYRNKTYLVSDNALITMSQRCGVSGEKTFTRTNIIRNMHLADALTHSYGESEMVIRELNGMKKIFSCLGSRYSEVPMSILYKMIDRLSEGDVDVENQMGEPVVKYWCIDHNFTDIYVEFPDMVEEIQEAYKLPKDMVPGLFLCTSDTGFSSVIIRGTLRVGGRPVILDEIAKRHSNRTKLDGMIDDADKEIFSSYRKLPEQLCTLIGKTVCDYTKVDLSTSAGIEMNAKALDTAINKVMKKAFKGVLSQKKQDELKECIDIMIDDHQEYTLYDLAVLFMELPDTISGLDRNSTANFQKACGKIPFLFEAKENPEETLSIA